MSAEERWAARMEWESERGEIEIKSHWVVSFDWRETCDVLGCEQIALYGREVGLVVQRTGTKFSFCHDHNSHDFALDFYRRIGR